jgi:hypothetical protein
MYIDRMRRVAVLTARFPSFATASHRSSPFDWSLMHLITPNPIGSAGRRSSCAQKPGPTGRPFRGAPGPVGVKRPARTARTCRTHPDDVRLMSGSGDVGSYGAHSGAMLLV